MFFKNFVTLCFLVLIITNLLSAAAAESDSLVSEFEKTLVGVKYCRSPDGHTFHVFNDALHGIKSKKYASLNCLHPGELIAYTVPIDYSRTHLLAEEGVAIVASNGEFTQVATDGIKDCVGVVFRQIGEDSAVSKTMASHVSEKGAKVFHDFIAIADDFLAGIDPPTIRVDFITIYNTDKLLDLYEYVHSKGILDEHIILTGNFPHDKRPVHEHIFEELSCSPLTVVYLLEEYYETAVDVGALANSSPIREAFADQYFECMDIFVDAMGKVYPKIVGYPYDLGGYSFTLVPGLLKSQDINSAHIEIGLGGRVKPGRYGSFHLVPNTTQACEAELAILASREVLTPIGGMS